MILENILQWINKDVLLGLGLASSMFLTEIVRDYFVRGYVRKQRSSYCGDDLQFFSSIGLFFTVYIAALFSLRITGNNCAGIWFLFFMVSFYSFLIIDRLDRMQNSWLSCS
jgi:hypothetical protein